MLRTVIGLDIGGANLKASDGERRSLSRPFPLWREPQRLAVALRNLLDAFPPAGLLAVTMTGELADCFLTRSDGVNRILDAVETAAAGTPIAVWQTGGEFVSVDEARGLVPLVAAANWHALAMWGARAVPDGAGLLVDVGSTTTDVIPLCDGLPAAVGRSDLERLLSRELVYTGVRRTPVNAVAHAVAIREARCPLAAELFATMLDAYLILGEIAEDESDLQTADGRPTTCRWARHRLARMLCSDPEELSHEELSHIARELASIQQQRISDAVSTVLERLPRRCELVVTSGEGEFVARRVVRGHPRLAGVTVTSLADRVGTDHSRAACAFALARLAAE